MKAAATAFFPETMVDLFTQKSLQAEFLSESREALAHIEKNLMDLEANPKGPEPLNTVFRLMHTIKGSCRLMAFPALEELAHLAESLLELLRDNKATVSLEIITALLAVVDDIRHALEDIEQNRGDGGWNFSPVTNRLKVHIARANHGPAGPQEPPCPPEADTGPGGDACSLGSHDSVNALAGLKTIRLPIERVDDLMSMIGELGAAFNQLRYCLTHNTATAQHTMETMEQQIFGLHNEVLKYRLQPVARVWETYHRLVRDLSVATGKKVLLKMIGEETEVDRNVLLSVKDILGHMIRNAIDHGIETPQQRLAKGKPPVGRITLFAQQKQGQIHIEVSDDGAGLDVESIRSKAVAIGLASARQAEEMNRESILKFIFAQGFSTAKEVSKISGRGTGMDVVKSELEKINGTIAITSTPDTGTTFRLRIPQTMSIVPVLLVRSGESRFAIPQAGVVELLSFYGEEVGNNREGKMQSPMVRVRGTLAPVVRLEEVLRFSGKGQPENSFFDLPLRKECHIVVLHTEEGDFGLEVDRIEEPASLVIKPLIRLFSSISILAGTAVMPDGTISFLLNVPELAKIKEAGR